MKSGRPARHSDPIRGKSPGSRYVVKVSLGAVLKDQRNYRRIFKQHNGDGPWPCHFDCDLGPVLPYSEDQEWRLRECIHHKNGDHTDNRPENLAASHWSCHSSYHARATGLGGHVETVTHEQRRTWGALGGAVHASKPLDERSALGAVGQAAYMAATTPRQRNEQMRRAVAAIPSCSCVQCRKTMKVNVRKQHERFCYGLTPQAHP